MKKGRKREYRREKKTKKNLRMESSKVFQTKETDGSKMLKKEKDR